MAYNKSLITLIYSFIKNKFDFIFFIVKLNILKKDNETILINILQ